MSGERQSPAVFAVIPAAGLGRRMRRAGEGKPTVSAPKQLSELHGQPMLVRVLDAMEASNLAGAVVVVNSEVTTTIQTLRPLGTRRRYALNDRPEGEMIESIQIGLQTAIEWSKEIATCKPGGCGYLICPGDHPCIEASVVDRCVAEFITRPDRIVVATNEGRRGHPLILPGDLARQVLSWPTSRGLNELRREYPQRVLEVEVADPGVLIDVDTPADLDQARKMIHEKGDVES